MSLYYAILNRLRNASLGGFISVHPVDSDLSGSLSQLTVVGNQFREIIGPLTICHRRIQVDKQQLSLFVPRRLSIRCFHVAQGPTV